MKAVSLSLMIAPPALADFRRLEHPLSAGPIFFRPDAPARRSLTTPDCAIRLSAGDHRLQSGNRLQDSRQNDCRPCLLLQCLLARFYSPKPIKLFLPTALKRCEIDSFLPAYFYK